MDLSQEDERVITSKTTISFPFQWLPLPIFVLHRFIILAYNFGWLVYNIHVTGAKLFIYVSNWNYSLLVIYFAFASILSLKALYNDLQDEGEDSNGKQIPLVEFEMGSGDEDNDAGSDARENADDALRLEHKLLWLMHTISSNGGLFVTVVYCGLLFQGDSVGAKGDANNITKYVLNSVFMLIDTCLSSVPVRIVHWLYAVLYFAVYLMFSVIYWRLGGTNNQGKPYIYSALNYEDFRAKTGGLLIVFLLLVLPLFQLFLFGVTKLRDHLHRKHKGQKGRW